MWEQSLTAAVFAILALLGLVSWVLYKLDERDLDHEKRLRKLEAYTFEEPTIHVTRRKVEVPWWKRPPGPDVRRAWAAVKRWVLGLVSKWRRR